MTDLQLRVGGKYLDRTGNVIEIVAETSDADMPFTSSGKCTYSRSGRFDATENMKSNFDLIAEVADGNEPPPAPTSPPTAARRERAALAALTGILAGGNPDNLFSPDKIAPWCVRHADALIAALRGEITND